jgi:hypothetical protein
MKKKNPFSESLYFTMTENSIPGPNPCMLEEISEEREICRNRIKHATVYLNWYSI